MRIAFVTFGNFDGHATLKRETGMAGPLAKRGHADSFHLRRLPSESKPIVFGGDCWVGIRSIIMPI